MRKELSPKLRKFIEDNLRRISYMWSTREEAKNLGRFKEKIGAGGRAVFVYVCKICGKKCTGNEIQLDHIEPVVPLNGYSTGLEFDAHEYIYRMFPDSPDAWQKLCKSCHNKKTQKENELRRQNKKL